MNKISLQEYQNLTSEAATLESFLERLPESEILERASLQSRVEEIRETLKEIPPPARQPVRARLTFRGKPVAGTHGVMAEFGSQAVGAFTDAVSALGATLGDGPALRSKGKIPGREGFQMLITGVATGSFGFEFEEAATEDLTLFPVESPLEPAIQKVFSVLEATTKSDDDLTEALEDADPRALDSVRKFLEIMGKNEAACALNVGKETFRFLDVGQVRRSIKRLEQDNIHEAEIVMEGQLLGVFPKRRTFEFEKEDGEVIHGKLGPEIEDAMALNAQLNQSLTVTFHTRQVGNGKPRYQLVNLD